MIDYLLMPMLFILVAGGLILFFIRRIKRLEASYKTAFEHNQKRLDQQTSRINILTRALPTLHHLVMPNESMELWKNLCLDEARALLWAEGAYYYRFVEKDQELILDLVRGANKNKYETGQKFSLLEGELGKAAVQRVPLIRNNPGDKKSAVLIPLVIGGDLWGVFEFTRQADNPFSQRDVSLISMFVNHMSLSLENKNLIANRERFYLELIQTLAETLDSKDASAQGQSRRARELARGMARELDLPKEFIYYLEFAALMHDIGKIAIDERILKKPGKLTEEEFEIIKKHPEIGHKILSPVRLLAPVAPMVLYHQEWFNGKGYPEGLSGEEIPLGARIVAILDAWGAMTSDRPWRRALSPVEAANEIKKGSGSQFDPHVVEAFFSTAAKQGYLNGQQQ